MHVKYYKYIVSYKEAQPSIIFTPLTPYTPEKTINLNAVKPGFEPRTFPLRRMAFDSRPAWPRRVNPNLAHFDFSRKMRRRLGCRQKYIFSK